MREGFSLTKAAYAGTGREGQSLRDGDVALRV